MRRPHPHCSFAQSFNRKMVIHFAPFTKHSPALLGAEQKTATKWNQDVFVSFWGANVFISCSILWILPPETRKYSPAIRCSCGFLVASQTLQTRVGQPSHTLLQTPMRLYGLKVKQFCMPFSFVFCSVGVFNWRPCAFSSCTDFSCQLTTKLSHISRFRDPKTPPKPNRRWKMLLGSEPTFPLEMLQISGSMIIFGGEWASASLSHLSSMFRGDPPSPVTFGRFTSRIPPGKNCRFSVDQDEAVSITPWCESANYLQLRNHKLVGGFNPFEKY